MQSGTILHIALLKKLSHNATNYDYHERFNKFKTQMLPRIIPASRSSSHKSSPFKQYQMSGEKSHFVEQKSREWQSQRTYRMSKQEEQNLSIDAWSTESGNFSEAYKSELRIKSIFLQVEKKKIEKQKSKRKDEIYGLSRPINMPLQEDQCDEVAHVLNIRKKTKKFDRQKELLKRRSDRSTKGIQHSFQKQNMESRDHRLKSNQTLRIISFNHGEGKKLGSTLLLQR